MHCILILSFYFKSFMQLTPPKHVKIVFKNLYYPFSVTRNILSIIIFNKVTQQL